jgi:hypothetical protein
VVVGDAAGGGLGERRDRAGAGVGGLPQGDRHARDEPDQQRDAGERIMHHNLHRGWPAEPAADSPVRNAPTKCHVVCSGPRSRPQIGRPQRASGRWRASRPGRGGRRADADAGRHASHGAAAEDPPGGGARCDGGGRRCGAGVFRARAGRPTLAPPRLWDRSMATARTRVERGATGLVRSRGAHRAGAALRRRWGAAGRSGTC